MVTIHSEFSRMCPMANNCHFPVHVTTLPKKFRKFVTLIFIILIYIQP